MRLLDQMFQLKLVDFVSMESYLTCAATIQEKLVNMGHGLDDDLVALILLLGLPSDYMPLKMTLLSLNMNLSSDFVQKKLRDYTSQERKLIVLCSLRGRSLPLKVPRRQ